MTTKDDIREWFERGLEQHAEYLITVCDTFSHEDYPVFATSVTFKDAFEEHNGRNMQRIIEVYDLERDPEMQIAQGRCLSCPPGDWRIK